MKIEIDELVEFLVWDDRAGNRKECYMADGNQTYTYGKGKYARTYEPVKPPVWVKIICSAINAQHGTEYDVCVANYYDNEKNHLGWHADDSPEIDQDHPIAVVSFGAEREIWTRPIIHKENIEKTVLRHGDVFTMDAGFQRSHEHRIPKSDRPCGPRLSLTFRKYKAP